MSETITRDISMDVKTAMEARMEQTSGETTYEHGAYVPGKDGRPGGIYIDNDEELRRQTENPTTKAVEDKLREMDLEIKGATKSEETKEEDRFANMKPEDMRAIQAVEKEFEKYDIGNDGLVRKDLEPNTDSEPKHEQVHATREAYEPTTTEEPAETEDEKPVQFTVDSENADKFISTLTKEEREKVQRTKTIVVNEVKTLNLPTATRVITSADEYKRVIPKKIHSEVIEVPLLNSGYAATVHGCGSLAMASIIPDTDTDVPDYQKRYQFAYDNLVSTSIGKMSFNDFCLKTSITDIDTILLAILRASDPDENEILVDCRRPGCGEQFKVKYRLSQLIDPSSIKPDMDAEINKIMTNKDIYTNAVKVQEESKIMQVKYVEIKIPADPEINASEQTIVIEIKNTDGILAIERYPLVKELSEKYSRYIVGFALVIPRIFITCTLENEVEPSTYEVNDPGTILEIISDLDSEAIQAIGSVADPIMEYDRITYSFKGPINCPKCRNLIKSIPCTIDSLIFHRVGEAIR